MPWTKQTGQSCTWEDYIGETCTEYIFYTYQADEILKKQFFQEYFLLPETILKQYSILYELYKNPLEFSRLYNNILQVYTAGKVYNVVKALKTDGQLTAQNVFYPWQANYAYWYQYVPYISFTELKIQLKPLLDLLNVLPVFLKFSEFINFISWFMKDNIVKISLDLLDPIHYRAYNALVPSVIMAAAGSGYYYVQPLYRFFGIPSGYDYNIYLRRNTFFYAFQNEFEFDLSNIDFSYMQGIIWQAAETDGGKYLLDFDNKKTLLTNSLQSIQQSNQAKIDALKDVNFQLKQDVSNFPAKLSEAETSVLNLTLSAMNLLK